jgi:hypothetical protein
MSITVEEFTKRTGAPPITSELTTHEWLATGRPVPSVDGEEYQCRHCKWFVVVVGEGDFAQGQRDALLKRKQPLCCDPDIGAHWPDPKPGEEPSGARVVGINWEVGEFLVSKAPVDRVHRDYNAQTFELPSKLLREHGAPTP